MTDDDDDEGRTGRDYRDRFVDRSVPSRRRPARPVPRGNRGGDGSSCSRRA